MTVYVDDLVDYSGVKSLAPRMRRTWCHLLPDPRLPYDDEGALRELRSFAYRIGCQPGWEQRSNIGMVHFDLTERMRATAVRHGAREVTRIEWGRMRREAYQEEMEGADA